MTRSSKYLRFTMNVHFDGEQDRGSEPKHYNCAIKKMQYLAIRKRER